MGFPRQEYWNEVPYPPLGDLPNPGIEPKSPAFEGGYFTSGPPGNAHFIYRSVYLLISSSWCIFSPRYHLPTSTLVTISLFSMFVETHLWHLSPGEWCGWMIIHTCLLWDKDQVFLMAWKALHTHVLAVSRPTSSLHSAPIFQSFVHTAFSLTSQSGVCWTLFLKCSVPMPLPS